MVWSQGAGVSPFWRQCKLNHDYEFSPTYPAVLYVPTMISDDALGKIKNFRSKVSSKIRLLVSVSERYVLGSHPCPLVLV